jgi:hypothetical protein
MATINGLTPTVVTHTKKANKKRVANKSEPEGHGQTTKVANAVSQSIRAVKESDIDRVNLQYDLPEGQSRKAMQAYMDILNRAKKEDLAQLFGVDIYI